MFVFGFIVGCLFSLILTNFMAGRVGKAVRDAIKNYENEKAKEKDDDDDDPNWWKKGKTKW